MSHIQEIGDAGEVQRDAKHSINRRLHHGCADAEDVASLQERRHFPHLPALLQHPRFPGYVTLPDHILQYNATKSSTTSILVQAGDASVEKIRKVVVTIIKKQLLLCFLLNKICKSQKVLCFVRSKRVSENLE